MKTCFFIGHHDAPPAIRELLDVAVERHIKKYGVTRFIVGHYGAFDSMAAAAVIRAKMKYEGVELLLLLPYHPTERPIQPEKGFDATFYPEGMEKVLRRYAIPRANEYVIRHICDYLIAYDRFLATKTHDFVEIARKRAAKDGLHIENLADLL